MIKKYKHKDNYFESILYLAGSIHNVIIPIVIVVLFWETTNITGTIIAVIFNLLVIINYLGKNITETK